MTDSLIPKQGQQLKKHVGTVHIASPLSLLQRKAVSVLLFNAYPRLMKERTHSIPVAALSELLGFDSKNLGPLNDALRGLVLTGVEWVGADSDRWAMTTFLSFVEMKGGVCTYRYDEFLAEKLYRPEVYARINLSVLPHFKSKYTVALYENCARYRPNGDFRGGTPEWSIEEFRAIMGVRNVALFNTFKRINERIIGPSVKEINEYSDIIISPKMRREGRNFIGIRFSVKENPQLSVGFMNAPEEPDRIGEIPEIQQMHARYAIPVGVAFAWFNAYGRERFCEVLEMADREAIKNVLRNPIGFITAAFEKGFVPGRDPRETAKALRKERAAKGGARSGVSALDDGADTVDTLQNRYQAHLQKTALDRVGSLPAAEQHELMAGTLQEYPILKARFSSPIDAGESSLARTILADRLIEEWDLKTEMPFSEWAEKDGKIKEQSVYY